MLGGQTSRICGEVKEAKSLVFTGPNKRHACTGFLHTPEAATLQFYFAIGTVIIFSRLIVTKYV